MSLSTRLDGKRVLITQAADFMGPALVRVFTEQGAVVVAHTDPLADAPHRPADREGGCVFGHCGACSQRKAFLRTSRDDCRSVSSQWPVHDAARN